MSELEHFYHGEIGQPLNEWGIGTNCYGQWIGPLLFNETTKQHGNQLNFNYLIFNAIFNIIDHFMIFSLWIIDTCHYLC